MACTEAQEEELEVLQSIYGDDPCFKATSPNTFQYRVGEQGEDTAFLVEVRWPADYPDCAPIINMDTFFNNHLNSESKDHIISSMNSEAEDMLGSAMTYSLFEHARNNGRDLIVVTNTPTTHSTDNGSPPRESASVIGKTTKDKKEVLSKAAKRRRAGRPGALGEQPRGWNWVDIVKHVSFASNFFDTDSMLTRTNNVFSSPVE